MNQAHVLHFSCLVWFIAVFLKGVTMVLAMHLRNPRKSPVWTLSPKHRGQCTDCREPARRCPQSWPGWLEKVLHVGISIHCFSLQKIAAQKGRAVSFLPLFCIPCLDSLWLCVPCLVRAPCGFTDTRRYLLPIKKKKIQSVEKNTSQWESEILAASNAFQVSMVL